MQNLFYFCAGANANILPAHNLRGILLNTPDYGDGEKRLAEAKTVIASSGAGKVMLDSGGFQLLKAEENGVEISFEAKGRIRQGAKINLTPQHVINAAKEIQPDIFVALDFPIGKVNDPSKREFEFMKKLGFNVRWAIETAILKKKHGLKSELLIPVQCYNLKQFELFYQLIGGIEFEGISMPVRNMKIHEVALFLIKFYQLGIKKVHLLGTTSFFNIALAGYAAAHLFEWVSFDSTSWRLMAEKECYLNPHDLSVVRLGKEVIIEKEFLCDCACPWCQGKSFSYIQNLPYADKFVFLMCHNHLAIDRITEEIFKNSKNIAALYHFLLKNSHDSERVEEFYSILKTIDFFKYVPLEKWQPFLNTQMKSN